MKRRDYPEFEQAVRALADAHKVQAVVAYLGPVQNCVGLVRADSQDNAGRLLRGIISLALRTLTHLPTMLDFDREPDDGPTISLVKHRKAVI